MAQSHFTLRQLEIFAAVVRTGQVKRAADALYLSQAAVSQALTELSTVLDVPLFERKGRAIVPTASARQLLQLSGPSLEALHEIPERLSPRGVNQALSGQMSIAASSTIARYVLPHSLARLRLIHPTLSIHVTSGNSADVETQVAELCADIGFIEGPSRRNDVVVSLWRTDVLQIIAPPNYPIGEIHADRLADHPWVSREPGSGTRAVFEQSLALNGYPAPKAELVMNDSGSIVRAVAAGAGLACVSALAASQASTNAKVQYVQLDELQLTRPLWRVQRTTPVVSPLLKGFINALEQVTEKTE